MNSNAAGADANAQIIGEYLKVEQLPGKQGAATKQWSVINRTRGSRLGLVRWDGPWRQYTFLPGMLTVFSSGCLQDIAKFVTEQNSLHRKGRQ